MITIVNEGVPLILNDLFNYFPYNTVCGSISEAFAYILQTIVTEIKKSDNNEINNFIQKFLVIRKDYNEYCEIEDKNDEQVTLSDILQFVEDLVFRNNENIRKLTATAIASDTNIVRMRDSFEELLKETQYLEQTNDMYQKQLEIEIDRNKNILYKNEKICDLYNYLLDVLDNLQNKYYTGDSDLTLKISQLKLICVSNNVNELFEKHNNIIRELNLIIEGYIYESKEKVAFNENLPKKLEYNLNLEIDKKNKYKKLISDINLKIDNLLERSGKKENIAVLQQFWESDYDIEMHDANTKLDIIEKYISIIENEKDEFKNLGISIKNGNINDVKQIINNLLLILPDETKRRELIEIISQNIELRNNIINDKNESEKFLDIFKNQLKVLKDFKDVNLNDVNEVRERLMEIIYNREEKMKVINQLQIELQTLKQNIIEITNKKETNLRILEEEINNLNSQNNNLISEISNLNKYIEEAEIKTRSLENISYENENLNKTINELSNQLEIAREELISLRNESSNNKYLILEEKKKIDEIIKLNEDLQSKKILYNNFYRLLNEVINEIKKLIRNIEVRMNENSTDLTNEINKSIEKLLDIDNKLSQLKAENNLTFTIIKTYKDLFNIVMYLNKSYNDINNKINTNDYLIEEKHIELEELRKNLKILKERNISIENKLSENNEFLTKQKFLIEEKERLLHIFNNEQNNMFDILKTFYSDIEKSHNKLKLNIPLLQKSSQNISEILKSSLTDINNKIDMFVGNFLLYENEKNDFERRITLMTEERDQLIRNVSIKDNEIAKLTQLMNQRDGNIINEKDKRILQLNQEQKYLNSEINKLTKDINLLKEKQIHHERISAEFIKSINILKEREKNYLQDIKILKSNRIKIPVLENNLPFIKEQIKHVADGKLSIKNAALNISEYIENDQLKIFRNDLLKNINIKDRNEIIGTISLLYYTKQSNDDLALNLQNTFWDMYNFLIKIGKNDAEAKESISKFLKSLSTPKKIMYKFENIIKLMNILEEFNEGKITFRHREFISTFDTKHIEFLNRKLRDSNISNYNSFEAYMETFNNFIKIYQKIHYKKHT